MSAINFETLRLLEKVSDRMDNIENVLNKIIMRTNALERNLNKVPVGAKQKLLPHSHPYALFGHTHDGTSEIPELIFFNAIFIEKFTAVVTSDGAVVTMTITELNGANTLTMRFSDAYHDFDVSGGGATINLVAGTDAAPQANYIYIRQSGLALTDSVAGWEAGEHIKIAYCLVPSAGFVQTNNVYINQNINEGTDNTVGQGHLTHMAQRSRLFGAKYFSGIDAAGVDDYLTIGVGTTDFKSGAGVVWQMHSHAFGAFDTSGGDLVLVKNWNGDAYHDITDLFDIVDDSAGVALANKWFTIVVWGAANKSGELDYIMINLPSGSYATEAKATEDSSGYTDFSIPRQFSLDSSTGFLICSIVVKQAATWSYGSTKDLRGITSAFAVAGATGTGITDHTSLTSIGTNTHAQVDTHIADVNGGVHGLGAISNAPVLDQSVDTTSSPTFVSPVVGTSLLPDASGGADIGTTALEFGDMFLADDKDIKFGSDQDWEINFSSAASALTITGGFDYYLNLTGTARIRDKDDAFATLWAFDTSARTLAMGAAADIMDITHHGNYLLGGTGGDDERLRVPYLTGVPASVDNGSIWMEADGLHIYWNGAEKLVAGV